MNGDPGPRDPGPRGQTTGGAEAAEDRTPRPWVERIGLAAIALVLAAMFAFVAVASWNGSEPFLAVMAGIGSLMTLWVGALTLVRG